MIAYNLNEIYDIQSTMNEFDLPENIEKIMKVLVDKLGINVTKTRIIKKDRTKNTDNQWNRKEPFKASVFEKSEGIDEHIDMIRGIMNKITKNNYETQYKKLLECIEKIWNEDFENVDNSTKELRIIECFTNVTINNRFYAELYAKTFYALIEKYVAFEKYQNSFIDKYNELSETFMNVDPDENYDEFCRINKVNEQRKSVLTFLIYAVYEEIYSFNVIRDIITKYFLLIEQQKSDKQYANINEEILENIFVVFSEGKALIMSEVSRYDLLKQIKELSGLSSSQNPGITNRMRFKCMDILDLYK